MSNTIKGSSALCISLLTIFSLIIGCEDPGSVGEEYVERSELTFDTLSIQSTQNQNYIGYSGRLAHVVVGNYSDELFGDISAVSIMKPTLTVPLPEGDSLDESYSMKLKLLFDKANTYGDTLNPVNYSVYEVTSYWNGTNFKINSDVTIDESIQVGSFTVNGEDSVTIDLADSWKQTYAGFYYSPDDIADSLLQYELKGLAIVADENANRIIHPSIGRSEFMAISGGSEPDTTVINIRDWAYKLERSAENYPAEVSSMHSTVEGLIHFSITEFIPMIEGKNFVNAELVFFEAADELQNSLQSSEIRPPVNAVNADLGFESDPAYEFQFGSADLLGSKTASDYSIRINVTDYFNNYLFGNEDREDLYLGNGSTEGVLRSTIVYNELAPEALQPKLILTFLEGE